MRRFKPAAAWAADAVRQARAVVFDFDGTLVDSNPIKRRAFERCFADLPQPLRRQALAYCLANHHTPRMEKFRHVYTRILKQPYTAAMARRLARQFAEHTTQAVIQAREIPAADALLRAVGRARPAAILSSTPHALLKRILKARGWAGHVRTIRGAPVDKAQWLRRWARRQRCPAEAVLFFGDTPEDAASACKAGCGFVGIGPMLDGADAAVAVLPNFRGLLRWQRRSGLAHAGS